MFLLRSLDKGRTRSMYLHTILVQRWYSRGLAVCCSLGFLQEHHRAAPDARGAREDSESARPDGPRPVRAQHWRHPTRARVHCKAAKHRHRHPWMLECKATGGATDSVGYY